MGNIEPIMFCEIPFTTLQNEPGTVNKPGLLHYFIHSIYFFCSNKIRWKICSKCEDGAKQPGEAGRRAASSASDLHE